MDCPLQLIETRIFFWPTLLLHNCFWKTKEFVALRWWSMHIEYRTLPHIAKIGLWPNLFHFATLYLYRWAVQEFSELFSFRQPLSNRLTVVLSVSRPEERQHFLLRLRRAQFPIASTESGCKQVWPCTSKKLEKKNSTATNAHRTTAQPTQREAYPMTSLGNPPSHSSSCGDRKGVLNEKEQKTRILTSFWIPVLLFTTLTVSHPLDANSPPTLQCKAH